MRRIGRGGWCAVSWLILILTALWAAFLLREARQTRKARGQLSHVIHVNGTRGKSTVCRLIEAGRLSLDGLITHRAPAARAEEAYRTAFADPACLKMVLDWRDAA